MKKNQKICSVIIAIISWLVTLPMTSCGMQTTNEYKPYKKDYSIAEMKAIESSSFKKLNTINYPTSKAEIYQVSDEYRLAMSNFSNKMYHELLKGTNNFSFSPFGLYSVLSLLSVSTDKAELSSTFDDLLGMTKETRKENYIKSYQTDYFSNDYGTLQLYNGLFLSNKWNYNSEYISELTDYYCEAYCADFLNDKDVNKILSWTDNKVKEKSFLSKEDLEIDENTAFLLFTTLYMNNKWQNKFETSSTYGDNFTLSDGTEKRVSYMSHSYFGKVYDNDTYLSCMDYYANNLKVKYLIPKETLSIYELIKEKNIFIENEENKILSSSIEEEELCDSLVVNLSVPKFENQHMINFSRPLENLGLSAMFNPVGQSFNYMFTGLDEAESIYLSFVKQKNKVSFSEDGTIIKSVTVAGGKDKAVAIFADTIDIKLNKPFIYIIYDANDLPIYVGNVSNPN